jgi:hypothetical protein
MFFKGGLRALYSAIAVISKIEDLPPELFKLMELGKTLLSYYLVYRLHLEQQANKNLDMLSKFYSVIPFSSLNSIIFFV